LCYETAVDYKGVWFQDCENQRPLGYLMNVVMKIIRKQLSMQFSLETTTQCEKAFQFYEAFTLRRIVGKKLAELELIAQRWIAA